MIYLEPTGGLANRMRVIASGIRLKNDLQTKLVVIWNENYELRCPYENLFEPPDNYVVIKKNRRHNYITRSAQSGLLNKLKATVKNRVLGISYCLTEEDFFITDFNDVAKKHKVLYIKTCQQFNSAHEEFKSFKPVALLQNQISAVSKLFENKTVGIQIRRTDNALSIKNSPLHLFIEAMNKLIAEQHDVLFFLATDDVNTELELISIFKNKIINNRKEFTRESVKGIQDAVVDLFLLSKTNYIMGSYYSSFSEVAAELG